VLAEAKFGSRARILLTPTPKDGCCRALHDGLRVKIDVDPVTFLRSLYRDERLRRRVVPGAFMGATWGELFRWPSRKCDMARTSAPILFFWGLWALLTQL